MSLTGAQPMRRENRRKYSTHHRRGYACLIRWPARALKATAWLVMVSFLVNVLTPVGVSAKTPLQSLEPSAAPAKASWEMAFDAQVGLEDTLDRMNRRLNGQFEYAWQETLAAKTKALPHKAASRAELAALESGLKAPVAVLDAQQPTLHAYFAQTPSGLKTRDAATMPSRAQGQALQQAQRYTQLKALLAAIPAAKTDSDYKAAVAAAAAFMHSHSAKPKRTEFDPAHLAFGPPRERARAALTDATAIRTALGLSSADAVAPDETPPKMHAVAADSLPPNLASTEDAQITPAIEAKARELKTPLAIYHFVRNTVEYQPTYGSIQGADHTLQTLHGNDIDQASLLIALLRAANIPARYVYGTIRVPIAQVENWVGGVTDPVAALDLMGQGGIPVQGLAQGGVIRYAQIEHVWVEAQMQFAPSRGALVAPGTDWVPMDPSFKQYTYAASFLTPDLYSDTSAIATAISASATIGAGGGSATGLDFQPLLTGMDTFKQKLADKIQASHTHPTLMDLVGAKTLVAENAPMLAGSLPYPTLTAPTRFDVLPDALRVYATLQLAQSTSPAGLDDAVFRYSVSLIRLTQSSLLLSAHGSTPADQRTWDSMSGTDFPPYLIAADEVLTLDGTEVARAKHVSLGDAYTLSVEIKGAGLDKFAQFDITAGDALVVGFDTAGITPPAAQALLDKSDWGTVEDNLFLAAQAYWFSDDLLSQALSGLQHTVAVRLPSVGIFAAPIGITYSFGVPVRATYRSHAIDVKLNQSAVVARDGSRATRIAYVENVGVMGSFLEGLVPEKLFHKLMGAGSNTTSLLELANAHAMAIHHITASNAATQLPLLDQPQAVLRDIANAINAGQEVTIPRATQTNHGWTGTGYILSDPTTGSADYRINGGLSGDSQTECGRSTEPVPVVFPAVSLISDLLSLTSPIYIDDNGDINTGGIAVAVLSIAAIALLAIGTGGSGVAVAAAAAAGRSVGLRVALSLVAMLGMDEALATDEDDCSCTPRALGYHRGGNARHDYCADIRPPNKQMGSDWEVSGKAFDALATDNITLWEVKTGAYSGYPKFLKDTVLKKFLEEFQLDAENAKSCKNDFVFGVTDANLAADMQNAIENSKDSSSSKASVRVITCP